MCSKVVTAITFILFASLVGMSGVAQSAAQNGNLIVYKLGPGDSLRVTVYEEPDLSGEFEVDGSGNLSMPLIGEVAVGDLTLREVESAIVTMLLDGYLKQPRVSIDVLNYRPFYILGEVHKPGSYSYVNGMTVYNAIALGGGFTPRAKEKGIEITRGNDPGKRAQKASIDTQVLPGDIVRVKERFF